MEIARLGNHLISACPYCDTLLHAAIRDDNQERALAVLDESLARHLAESSSCEEERNAAPSLEDAVQDLREAFTKADQKRQERLANHPMNGTGGWWSVVGIRHNAIAWATSAPEALQKCVDAGKIDTWEGGDVQFIGKTMPEVF